jgi:hypothetical protein
VWLRRTTKCLYQGVRFEVLTAVVLGCDAV